MNKEIKFAFETNHLEVYKGDDGKPHIRAIASDSLEDRQGDVITETCIKQMSTQVSKNEIPLLPDHRSSFEIGKSSYGDTRRNPSSNGLELLVDFELDDRYTEAQVLFNEVQSGRCKRQLSIGGYLNKNNPRAAFLDERNGKLVTVLDDIILDHIAVTREDKAANPRTNFVEAIVKAIDDAGYDISKEGLVKREKDEAAAIDPFPFVIPQAILKLDPKYVSIWKRVWKDTFIRQMHIPNQSVEQAEASAAGVATAVVSKQLGTPIDVNPEEYAVERKDKETFVIGSTKSKKGHTHLWVAREIGEKIIDGMVLTVKGHNHRILETGECDDGGDHRHTMVRKDRKVAEPSTELSAPVGLLYFGKGYDSQKDVEIWLDANGIEPISISRIADSTFTVEFSLAPFTRNSDEVSTEEEEIEMAEKAQETEIEKATVPYKAWPLSDEQSWSWSASDGNELLGPDGDNWMRYKQAHTWYNDERGATPEVKQAYGLPHHKLSNDELKTYMGGVIAAVASLNGARGGFRQDTSEEGRRSLYDHLRKHYQQADREAPPLKNKWMERTKEDFSHPNPKTLSERDYEDFVFALEQCGFKDNIPEFLTKEWWMTWDPEITGIEEIPETEKAIWSSIEKATVEHEDVENKVEETDKQKAEETSTENSDSGSGDDNKTETEEKEEVSKSEDSDSMKKLEETISGLASATQKAISELTSTVCEIGARIAKLEGTSSEEKTEEKSEEKVEEKVEEKTEEKVEEKADETSEEKSEEKVEDKTEEKVDENTEKSEETSSEEKPAPTPAEIFAAFHSILESVGMTAKDFFGAMAQKSLDSMGPTLTGTVEKTVKSSILALQNGVKAEVEKSVSNQLDAKLQEVAKDFQETIEKLDVRLEKVENIGGVPKGASGQEGVSEASDESGDKFKGIFSRALLKR